MLKYNWTNLAFLFLLITACGKSIPELNGFNQDDWKKDKNACLGKRAEMKGSLQLERHKFLALTELQIVELLGSPDQNELYKRNQKFYYYFLEPSPDCAATQAAPPLQLIIRFNAMGLAKEVLIE